MRPNSTWPVRSFCQYQQVDSLAVPFITFLLIVGAGWAVLREQCGKLDKAKDECRAMRDERGRARKALATAQQEHAEALIAGAHVLGEEGRAALMRAGRLWAAEFAPKLDPGLFDAPPQVMPMFEVFTLRIERRLEPLRLEPAYMRSFAMMVALAALRSEDADTAAEVEFQLLTALARAQRGDDDALDRH